MKCKVFSGSTFYTFFWGEGQRCQKSIEGDIIALALLRLNMYHKHIHKTRRQAGGFYIMDLWLIDVNSGYQNVIFR